MLVAAQPGQLVDRVECSWSHPGRQYAARQLESLLVSIDGTSDEHKAGTAMFAGIEKVFLMETMMRVRDPVLRVILEKMRTLGGARLTDEE